MLKLVSKTNYQLCSSHQYTGWFIYDLDDLCVNKSQFVPVIFEPPCIFPLLRETRVFRTCLLHVGYFVWK
jgi:hypothetical protein